MLELIRNTVTIFCLEFVRHPYLCYTEHGQHALFYSRLYNALAEDQRDFTWGGQKVCVLQKEYPTAAALGKPQRQHWDIAVLKSPPESIREIAGYDYLKLFSVIEFGMNEAKAHLEDDISRICHEEANLEHAFIVHLYRLSESGSLFSSRDWSSKSPRIVSIEEVRRLSLGQPVEIFYGLADRAGVRKPGVWRIRDGAMNPIK